MVPGSVRLREACCRVTLSRVASCPDGGGRAPPSCKRSNACVRVLQMNDNLLESWSDLDELKAAKSLETVYLERNPLQKDPQYRRKIMLALPTVRQIDATFVRF